MGILTNLRDRMIASQDGKSGHGSWRTANSGVVEGKPYVGYWSNGLFEGEDGSLWKYFEAPKDVRIEWLKDPEEAIANQAFFVDVCRRLGAALDAQTEKVRNDIRRSFHIQITQKPFEGIRPYPGCTPAHADYLSRIAEQYGKPVWHGFFGVQILPGSMFYEKHGFRDYVDRYLELMRSPSGLQWDMYKADIDEVDAIMKENGFVEPDFSNPEDESFAQLTAWHGVEDRQYGLSRQLQTTRMQQPTHGLSMVVPKWGEIVFHAIKPSDETRLTDPLGERARWAKPLFSPSSDVVLINIRGEIRAPSIADNLLDLKRIKRTDDHGMVKDLDDLHLIDQISLARTSVTDVKLPMLDNTEIVVGSLLPQERGVEPGIVKGVKRYGLQALPLVGRQHLGVLTSFPTYPRHIMRVPRGNAKRPELTNVMLPGVLAFSGLWRNTGTCGPGGVLMGLSDDLQFQEIYSETDAAYKESRVPGMLVTGRPGAGKTQQLLQMTCQMSYMGIPVYFFNPKKEGTLKATFDHIGGAVVSMNREYLQSNPGVLDPVHFLNDRSAVADILADAIFSAAGLLGSQKSQERTQVRSEIAERAADERNQSSWDILFGNGRTTTGLTDPSLRRFVEYRVQTSSVWRALISKTGEASGLKKKILSGKSVLFEWDKNMSLPDVTTAKSEYTDGQIDSLISVNVAFQYASSALRGRGGAIIVDEAWVLKASHESMEILNRGGREWRQANIMLVLGTQKILDFMGTGPDEVNMTTYFSRFLFMALTENDELELEAFYKATGLPRDSATKEYILNAGRDTRRDVVKNPIPKAYYIDTLHNWHGGIICGPWPQLELNLGRTDKGGEEARRAMGLNEEQIGHFRGQLASLAEENDNDPDQDPGAAPEPEGELVAG